MLENTPTGPLGEKRIVDWFIDMYVTPVQREFLKGSRHV